MLIDSILSKCCMTQLLMHVVREGHILHHIFLSCKSQDNILCEGVTLKTCFSWRRLLLGTHHLECLICIAGGAGVLTATVCPCSKRKR